MKQSLINMIFYFVLDYNQFVQQDFKKIPFKNLFSVKL